MASRTSQKRAGANRKNALRSTGPKTARGKRAVRWNALKHGLLAKEVVIRAGDGEESQEEFDALLARLGDDLQPVGTIEEMLAEKVAVCYWRLRRVVRCEVGEIRKHLDAAVWRHIAAKADEVAFEKRLPAVDGPSKQMLDSSLGLRYLIRVLAEVRDDVEHTGHVSDWGKNRLFRAFGLAEEGLPYWCLLFSTMATEGPEKAKEDPEHFGDTPPPETCKRMILKLIDDEKERLEGMMVYVKEADELELDARVASLALPEKDAGDRILRYETTIERQLYRAMNQLERLQRQRKGESVPPPVNVEVSAER